MLFQKLLKFILILFISLTLSISITATVAGCAGMQDALKGIKIGGSYDKETGKIGGWIEYRYDPEKSKAAGIPVLNAIDDKGRSVGEAYIVSKQTLQEIALAKSGAKFAETAIKQAKPLLKQLIQEIIKERKKKESQIKSP